MPRTIRKRDVRHVHGMINYRVRFMPVLIV